jgi:putative acetyltransferase
MKPLIRRECVGDFEAIRRVVAAAFKSPVEAELVDRIRASPEYMPELALVAELDGEVVGHVMITGALIRNDVGDRAIAMLSPLAVDPVHQRHGIGGDLVCAVVALADERGEPLVVLQGSAKFYSRFGFEYSTPRGIDMHLPHWAAPESAQVILLTAYDAADASLKGMVVEPAAFDDLD